MEHHDTGSRFPPTRSSIVDALHSDDAQIRRRAYTTLVEIYWRPVYAYMRLRWRRGPEDAQDLTQEFLARLFEKEFLQRYEPGRLRLRSFLRLCIDRFVQNAMRDAGRIKRGGQVQVLSLDFDTAEGDVARLDPPDPRQGEEFFAREWTRQFFMLAVEALRLECEARGKPMHFALFERYTLDDGTKTYEDLAREFEIRVTDVTNWLAVARRAFRRIVLEKLREITGSEAEFRAEARALLGSAAAVEDDPT